MSGLQVTTLSFAIMAGTWSGLAQEAKIPFQQIAHQAILPETQAISEEDSASSHFADNSHFAESSSNPTAPVSVPATPSKGTRTTTSSFWLLTGVHLGLATFDMALTQRCIAEHKCREGNPLVPSSMGGMLSVNLSLFSFSSYVGYHQKKRQSKVWWLAPAIGIASHSVGIASGLAHQ